MFVKTIDNKDNHSHGYFVVCQVEEQTTKYKSNFPIDLIERVEQFYSLATQAYVRSRLFLNYRKNFIVVKVEKPNRVDLTSNEVSKLNELAEQEGCELVKTASGLLYRFK